MTADECRAKAEELEQVAHLVSYGPDRTRLAEQARFWRLEAAKAEAAGVRRNAA